MHSSLFIFVFEHNGDALSKIPPKPMNVKLQMRGHKLRNVNW